MKKADLDSITDIYMPEKDDCFVYMDSPEAIAVDRNTELGHWLEHDLRKHIEDNSGKRDWYENGDELHVRLDGYIFRGHRDQSVDGTVINLRCIPESVPTIHLNPDYPELQLSIPKCWDQVLMHKSLMYGGLILYIADFGQGKSTTAAATIRSRLEKWGGLARVMEDPPELNLNGSWNQGVCFQIPVTQKKSLSDLIRGQMRAFPAVPGKILMVGEVRDNDSAGQLIRAAASGVLVMATLHAGSIESAMSRLVAMAIGSGMTEDLARDMVGSALRIAIHQRMVPKPSGQGRWQKREIKGEILVNTGGEKAGIATLIREGKFQLLTNEIDRQGSTLEKVPKEKSFKEAWDEL